MADDERVKQYTLRLVGDDVTDLEEIVAARQEEDPYVTIADVLRSLVLSSVKDWKRRRVSR